MTHSIQLEARFIVPDDMDEENVRNVMNEFFADLIRTDNFVDARLVDEYDLDETEAERLCRMLDLVDDDSLDTVDEFISEYTDEK